MSNVPSVPLHRTLRFKRGQIQDVHYAAANIVFLLMEHGLHNRKNMYGSLLHKKDTVEEALNLLWDHGILTMQGDTFGIRPVVGQEIYETLKTMPAENRSVLSYFTMEGYFPSSKRHAITARALGA